MKAHAEKIIVDTISTQIRNLKDNADVYKAVHGETGYNNLLVSLISKMTGGGATTNSGGTSGDKTTLDDDNDDEDE